MWLIRPVLVLISVVLCALASAALWAHINAALSNFPN